jgi:linoleoyl-CoA desaturase
MHKLRFSIDDGSQFYKELIKRIDHYFQTQGKAKTGNGVMHFKIALYFGLVILFYFLMIRSNSLLWFYSTYLLLGLSILLTAFNISHDAAHGVAVKSKFWNKVLFQVSFNLQGNNAYVWGKNHTESHHLYTNIEGSDIDVLNNPLVRTTKTQPQKWVHRYQFIYTPFLYLFYSLNWFLFRETLMLFNLSSRTINVTIPKTEIAKLIFFKLVYIGYAIILPIYILPFHWWHILIAFILNHFMISMIFTGVLAVSHLSDFVEHPTPNTDGLLNMSWPKLQMLTSIDYNASSALFNWTLGGFNAHTLHHLLPNICHVHYLKILPIFRATAEEFGIPYMEMPYGQALASHFRFLKDLGSYRSPKIRAFEKSSLK